MSLTERLVAIARLQPPGARLIFRDVIPVRSPERSGGKWLGRPKKPGSKPQKRYPKKVKK